jgi:biofilm protein TabA
MIVANLEHLSTQLISSPAMEKAVAFLRGWDKNAHEVGRVVIDGSDVYAEIQAYDTLPSGAPVFEGHRTYIDLQYMVEGDEIITWASIDQVNITSPYDAENDYWLGTASPEMTTSTRLTTGQLAVLYPTDGHAPRQSVGQPSPVKKIVVKVAVGR